MYPFIRLAKEFFKFRNAPSLGLTDTHVSHHICWPWDIDLWMELNNGRTLTLYDLSRLPLAKRVGLIRVLRDQRWGLTMAGASVRYRRRVRMFQRVEIRSRAVCWDEKFLYLEQSMWSGGEATSHILYRSAVTDKAGIVTPERVIAALAPGAESPEIPDWIAAWIAAEAQRPWPPA
ncbi:MAG: acyl-CoA thioesterase [Pseudomonadota bacterium]